MSELNFISLFSGIEAASVAWKPLGWNCLALAEIEPFPSAVLAYHYPDVPNLGDITKADWTQFKGKCDVVVGGPPCQAFSIAGLQNSLQDERGNLSLEYLKVVDTINPRWVITENVPGWLSTKDNAFGCFLAGLVGADTPLISPLERGRWTDAGMVVGPKRAAAWRILDAQYIGLAQRRRRVFVIASPRNGGNPAAILFESIGLQGNPPPSRKAGERIAPTVTGGAPFSGTGNERVEAEALVYTPSSIGSYKNGVGTLRATGGDAGGGSENLIVFDPAQITSKQNGSNPQPGGLCHTLHSVAPTLIVPINTQNNPQVRRLVPVEAEFLQGFPRDYTKIPWRGKPPEHCPDGPRYRSLGNSMAVPVMFWIGNRIQQGGFFA